MAEQSHAAHWAGDEGDQEVLAHRAIELAERAGQNWTLGEDGSALPAPDEIMRWIAGDHPDLSAELVLIADVGAMVDRLLAGKLTEAPALPQGAIDAFVMRSATARHTADVVAGLTSRLDLARAVRDDLAQPLDELEAARLARGHRAQRLPFVPRHLDPLPDPALDEPEQPFDEPLTLH